MLAAARARAEAAGRAGWPLALLVGLAAAAPLAWTPFFASDDGLVHLWRVWEYARTAAAVGPIVRWVPDVAYGYGAPLFTFYNPLAYALGAALVSVGLTAAAATRALFALSMVGAALGAYWLAEAWLARRAPLAALCAALLYAVAPYRIATVYQRGALAEALGLAVAPLVVLCAWRVVERRGVGWIVGLALATGAVVLFHTIAALMALPFAGLVGLARIVESQPRWARAPDDRVVGAGQRRAGSSRRFPRGLDPDGAIAALARLALGFGLGLALAATYWLPALAQQGSVHLERARWSGQTANFQAGFAWPWELVQASVVHDYGHRVDDDQTPLAQRFPRLGGVAFVALALGLAAGWRSRRLRRPSGLVALATIAAAFGLAAPAALPLWNRIDLLGAVQLGWRFLALLLLAAVPLAAELGAVAGRARWGALALSLLAAGGAVAALPLERMDWSGLRERPAELAAYERKDGQFALGALREYVPIWVATTPQELVLAPDRPEAEPLAPVEVSLAGGSATDRRYDVAAAAPTTVLLDLFYHPALEARLDGHPVALRASGDDGLTAVDLPPGRHRLAVGPAPTGLESLALALSGGAAGLCLLLGLGALALRGRPAGAAATSVLALVGLRALARGRPVAGAALALSLLWPAVSGAAPVAAPTSLLVPERPPELTGLARVLGAGVETGLVEGAGIVTVDLHVEALRPSSENEPLALWFIGPGGRRAAEEVAGPGRGLRPTARWRANELLVARSELRLTGGAEAGDYALWVGLGGDEAPIGTVRLPAAGAAPAAALSAPFRRHEAIFGPSLVLDGYTFDPDPSGGSLRGDFWWRRVDDRDAGPYEATLRLLDKQGLELATQTRRLGGAGQLRPETGFHLRAPPLPAESYRLELAVRAAGAADPLPARTFGGQPSPWLTLTWFDVRDPCRCVPATARPLDRRWADGIGLAGWEVRRVGEELDLALYWRAEAQPSRSYTIFLHALRGDAVVGQVDEQPNGGRRPTGDWRAGEVVRDHYRLKAPGATGLRVGLYTPADGRRLGTDPPSPESAAVLELPP